MKRDDGIIKGEARDGVTGSPPPRPYIVLPDPDAPPPPGESMGVPLLVALAMSVVGFVIPGLIAFLLVSLVK
jgi:hypothetical protein